MPFCVLLTENLSRHRADGKELLQLFQALGHALGIAQFYECIPLAVRSKAGAQGETGFLRLFLELKREGQCGERGVPCRVVVFVQLLQKLGWRIIDRFVTNREPLPKALKPMVLLKV